jgi:hypothetical protein
MSDISKVSFINAPSPAAAYDYKSAVSAPKTESVKPETAAEKEPAGSKAAEERFTPAQRELENVISVSEDGDTVQASDKALEEMEKEDELGGRVIAKPNAEEKSPARERIEQQRKEAEAAAKKRTEQIKEQAEVEAKRAKARKEEIEENTQKADDKKDARKEDRAAEAQKPSTYAGYSDTQLQQLYQKGVISKQDYDKEIENRKEAKQEQIEQNNEFSKEGSENVARKEEAARDNQELKNYERFDEANPLDITQRADVIANLQQANQDPFANITTN